MVIKDSGGIYMDFIKVTKDNGDEELMEVVTIFNKSNSNYNYIIYKSHDNEYFTGKYLGEDIVDLDVNLDYEEMEYAKGIFSALVGD